MQLVLAGLHQLSVNISDKAAQATSVHAAAHFALQTQAAYHGHAAAAVFGAVVRPATDRVNALAPGESQVVAAHQELVWSQLLLIGSRLSRVWKSRMPIFCAWSAMCVDHAATSNVAMPSHSPLMSCACATVCTRLYRISQMLRSRSSWGRHPC